MSTKWKIASPGLEHKILEDAIPVVENDAAKWVVLLIQCPGKLSSLTYTRSGNRFARYKPVLDFLADVDIP